jgi:hypothetical protein
MKYLRFNMNRTNFIRSFNGLDANSQYDLLIKSGYSKAYLEELKKDNWLIQDLSSGMNCEISDICEMFDVDLVADIWSNMEDL